MSLEGLHESILVKIKGKCFLGEEKSTDLGASCNLPLDPWSVECAIRRSVEFSEPLTATILKDISVGRGERQGNARAPTRGR